MKLKKIQIKNFKSIEEIEVEVKKSGNSYTTMFLGVNESGKSNILEAMSFLETPEEDFKYHSYHNQKDENNEPVDLYFNLAFEGKNTCLDFLRKKIDNGDLLHLEIINVEKNVYLENGESNFSEIYNYEVKNLNKGLFVKKYKKSVTRKDGSVEKLDSYELNVSPGDDEGFEELTIENFDTYFKSMIIEVIKIYEPSVTYWTPSKEYLISTEDLNKFSEDINSKPALKNIFLLAGKDTKESIQNAIKMIPDGFQRSKLSSILQESLDKYLKNVWKHNIDVIIDITETGQFTLAIKDEGEENRHDRLPLEGRSEGAKHFLSLILSLSIESKHEKRTNQLILIDEPESHLHPSGIRDLREELLSIGTKNYLFVSTHSPFLVDRKNKERNIIIKKNNSAHTETKLIDKNTNIIDDEVLREAFGLEVYKDLLNPHSILVEGASDKIILQKALTVKDNGDIGIANGHGSNIDTLAAKLNDVNISILVIVDDDSDGKIYKTKIIKSKGAYSSKNVMTIRDLVSGVVEGGTIEDMLGKNYVQSIFIKKYKKYYNETECKIEFTEAEPFLKQMKVFLLKEKKENIDKFIESLKEQLADDVKFSKNTFKTNFPLLDIATDEIIKKLKS